MIMMGSSVTACQTLSLPGTWKDQSASVNMRGGCGYSDNVKWQSVSLENISVDFPNLQKHMKHTMFHFWPVCHACWAVVQAISNSVFSGDMIKKEYDQKEGVFTSFRHFWRVLFLSLEGWTTELIMTFQFHHFATGPTFWRLFPSFSGLPPPSAFQIFDPHIYSMFPFWKCLHTTYTRIRIQSYTFS